MDIYNLQEKIGCAQYIFIITSALKVTSGVVASNRRFDQTIETIESIRRQDQNSAIILVDSSELALEPGIHDKITPNVDMFIDLGQSNPGTQIRSRSIKESMPIQHERNIQKALSEAYILVSAFMTIMTFFKAGNLKRIFKISGRYKLSEEFNLEYYDNELFLGKFAFLRRKKETYGSCYETRLWSVCESRLPEMPNLLTQVYSCILYDSVEAERAYFKTLSNLGVIEVPKIYVEGEIASTGYYHFE